MLAINHPGLGSASGGDWSAFTIRPRVSMPVRQPSPVISNVQPSPQPEPAVNQISPAPQSTVMSHVSPVLETEAQSPTFPASAAAASPVPSAAAPASFSMDGFLSWLTEETIFQGMPNGAIFAGGVIGALWLFSPKKGRR
jgi:hypothetical protein